MSRVVPFRAKAPALVTQRIEETLATTMYLVQTTGPTSFVVQEQNCDKKHKVLVGPLQSCSCGDADVCIHILFVMLKVLRVPATNPVVWQKSLIDSEVDALLRGDYREKTRTPPPKNATGFLKKHSKEGGNTEPQTETEESDAQRHELVPGEVCAICQEDMVADQPLTFCRKGCGNNFHIECMKVFGESRKQSKGPLICPLCRHDWGDLALTELKKEMDIANKAPNVHKNCKNVDLCDRCFKMNAHINHSFVMKKLVSDPWVPALRSSQARVNSVAAELVDELQNRDLTTNDYDLLLQLDQRDKLPVQDFLLSILSGQKVSAANAKSFGEPGAICSVCRQSLRIQADVRSVICGHAFHESCLARSILSKEYVCPHPGCGYVLFPGMHHSTVKKKVDAEGDKMPQKTPSSDIGDMSLCTMPLQQHSITVDHKNKATERSKPTKVHPRASSNSAPDFTGLSIGLIPTFSSTGAQPPVLPPLKDKPRGPTTVRPRSVDNQPRDSRSRELGGLTAAECKEPFSVGEGSGSIDDRLRHADELRSELRILDKERLRKQRLHREERVRQNISNNASNHAAVTSVLPPVGMSSTPQTLLPKHPDAGKEARGRLRSKTAPRTNQHMHDREESLLPELSIGAIRRI